MSLINNLTEKLKDGRFTLSAVAGLASVYCAVNLARTGIMRSTYPKLLRAPPKTKEPPYPSDVFPNGQDLETPYGRIRYYEYGPEDGKKLMFVHGISTPSPAWFYIAPHLVKAGYRVLIFDLFGRGYSDTPVMTHDIGLFVSQMTLLLAHLPAWDKFDLCGMSMGGPIVSHFAHYYPHRVDRLVLLCPAGGTPYSDLNLASKLVRSNLMPPWLLGAILPLVSILPRPQKGSLPWWQARVHPGYVFSFLSSFQNGPIFGTTEIHRSVVQSFGPRVRAIWGDKDDVVPMDTAKYFGGMEVSVIPDAGHFAVLTHAEQVVQHMLDFLGTAA